MGVWDGSPQASQFQPTARGLEALFQRIEKMERLLRELTGANILSAADLTLSKEGLTIASQLLVSGNTRIEGTLDLPAGIIGNDALANPVVPARFRASSTGFAVGTTFTTVVSQSIVVPSGMTKCVVNANAYFYTLNNSGFQTFTSGRAVINGIAGDPSTYISSSGQNLSDTAAGSALITGLTPGSTFAISTQVAIAAPTTAAATNEATISGTLLWFR